MHEVGYADHNVMLETNSQSSCAALESLPGALGSRHTCDSMLELGIAPTAASWWKNVSLEFRSS